MKVPFNDFWLKFIQCVNGSICLNFLWILLMAAARLIHEILKFIKVNYQQPPQDYILSTIIQFTSIRPSLQTNFNSVSQYGPKSSKIPFKLSRLRANSFSFRINFQTALFELCNGASQDPTFTRQEDDTRRRGTFLEQALNPWVSNSRPARLYYVTRDHICKLCTYYKNYTKL